MFLDPKWQSASLDSLEAEIMKIQNNMVLAELTGHSKSVVDQLQEIVLQMTEIREERLNEQLYDEYMNSFPEVVEFDGSTKDELTTKNKADTVAKISDYQYTFEEKK